MSDTLEIIISHTIDEQHESRLVYSLLYLLADRAGLKHEANEEEACRVSEPMPNQGIDRPHNTSQDTRLA
jgi:hypothetical protein